MKLSVTRAFLVVSTSVLTVAQKAQRLSRLLKAESGVVTTLRWITLILLLILPLGLLIGIPLLSACSARWKDSKFFAGHAITQKQMKNEQSQPLADEKRKRKVNGHSSDS